VRTILVADDQPDVREFFRVVLQNEGYRLLEAGDATSCIRLARESRPDLILLDWMMPEVDGMDALRVLKNCQDTREIPVVMVTALDGITEVRVATDAGADGYLTKPVEAADVIALVDRFTRSPVAVSA
jgi:CheY-like chemotaxis protein